MVTQLDNYDVVAQFKIWLKVRGWTVRQAATKMEVNHSYLNKMLRGTCKPTKNYTEKMCYLIHTKPIDFNTLKKK